MATQEEFDAAAEQVQNLVKRPGDHELLQLYALYKQATDGDISGKRPGMFDLKGRAKFDAWSRQKGKSNDTARDEYVGLVGQLAKKYGA